MPGKAPGTPVDDIVDALGVDWRRADLSKVDRALCAYAEKLTRSPSEMGEQDIEQLRQFGLSDLAVHDLIQVTSYFNYINRVADATHVDLEPEMRPYQ